MGRRRPGCPHNHAEAALPLTVAVDGERAGRREIMIRQRVGRSCTRSARTHARALLGRDGSRTRSQQRPSRSRAARMTSSADASWGPTTPRLLAPASAPSARSGCRR